MTVTSYALALGSNRRSRHGAPAETIAAAAAALGVERLSTIRATEAIGPAGRAFANAAAILPSPLDPPELLDELKALERAFGRRPGRRWGPRVLDLDIILWSGGSWAGPALIIPHPEFRRRSFVLEPLAEIAPDWRDPITALAVRHLLARLQQGRPVDHGATRT
ncbi:MAG TPA: 2-amino-4-hydroxy-6-hydroxymethyldihydropteridine diphosphokinase [Allosphingosinicella sp.]|nr:2-amino-4-hydroxy-6-hydroxymethyldihydropteridine diphosphokinase [Allosphingosinicella sp.]